MHSGVAVRTSNEDADTGWTTAGSVVITTKRGPMTGTAMELLRARRFPERALPIENPAEHAQMEFACTIQAAFSRQNYVGTLGGPLQETGMVFTSFEVSRECEHRLQSSQRYAI